MGVLAPPRSAHPLDNPCSEGRCRTLQRRGGVSAVRDVAADAERTQGAGQPPGVRVHLRVAVASADEQRVSVLARGTEHVRRVHGEGRAAPTTRTGSSAIAWPARSAQRGPASSRFAHAEPPGLSTRVKLVISLLEVRPPARRREPSWVGLRERNVERRERDVAPSSAAQRFAFRHECPTLVLIPSTTSRRRLSPSKHGGSQSSTMPLLRR